MLPVPPSSQSPSDAVAHVFTHQPSGGAAGGGGAGSGGGAAGGSDGGSEGDGGGSGQAPFEAQVAEVPSQRHGCSAS